MKKSSKTICHCGSGKKFKHCCSGKKPPTRSIIFKLKEENIISSVSFGMNGQIKLMSGDNEILPASARMTISRDREKGQKTLFSTPLKSTELNISAEHEIRKYHRILCIDTNTKHLHGRKISVACMGEVVLSHEGIFSDLINIHMIEFHNSAYKEENTSWLMLIGFIHQSSSLNADHTYAIVTDSDLGNHQTYNEGQSPYIADQFIPKNIKLIYSSDSGKALLGAAIKKCHSHSIKIMKMIEEDSDFAASALSMDSPLFTHYRVHELHN